MKEKLEKYIQKLIKETNKLDMQRIELIRHGNIKTAVYVNTRMDEKKEIIKQLEKIVKEGEK
jgi:hypothetical protein